MDLPSAKSEIALSTIEMSNLQKLQNWKIRPLPSPSSPPSENEQLEASKLLPPQLSTSIQRGDLSSLFSELEKLIDHGPQHHHISIITNQTTRAGNTMLHLAAMYERKEILDIIAHNFPHLIRRQNIRGNTVVHVVARIHNPMLMRIIKKCYESAREDGGGDGDGEVWRIENVHGNMALHEAVMACNVKGVEVLFGEDGGVAHLMNKEGKSPLYLGVETGNHEIINVLMRAPFLNRAIHQGTSPLHAAIFARSSGEITRYSVSQPLVKSWLVDTVSIRIRVEPDNGEIIQFQGERTRSNKRTRIWGRPMKKTISRSDLLMMLMDKRSHGDELINFKDHKGRLPLHCAASMGDVESVRILINKSPSTALEWNKKGYLPIHVACRKGHVNVVQEFVQQPWFHPMEFLNPKGQNILHIAAKRGKDRVVKYLLREKKLNDFESLLNQKDNNGNTPLHLASKYLFPKVLLLLTQEKSLNVNLLNNDGMTPRDIVMLIRKSPPTIRELLSYAILNSIGSPLSEKGRRLRRSPSKIPQVEWIKDRVSTILLVAILVTTVTFAAGYTVPGGLFSSENNKHLKIKPGTATLLNKIMFQIFTICDVIAMYSSTMGAFILLWAQLGDFHLAFSATYLALCLVALALVTMSVAFMAAIHVVVESLHWLAYSVMVMGIVFVMMFLLLFLVLTFPLGTRSFLLRHVSNVIFRVVIPYSGSYSKFKKVKVLKDLKKEE